MTWRQVPSIGTLYDFPPPTYYWINACDVTATLWLPTHMQTSEKIAWRLSVWWTDTRNFWLTGQAQLTVCHLRLNVPPNLCKSVLHITLHQDEQSPTSSSAHNPKKSTFLLSMSPLPHFVFVINSFLRTGSVYVQLLENNINFRIVVTVQTNILNTMCMYQNGLPT